MDGDHVWIEMFVYAVVTRSQIRSISPAAHTPSTAPSLPIFLSLLLSLSLSISLAHSFTLTLSLSLSLSLAHSLTLSLSLSLSFSLSLSLSLSRSLSPDLALCVLPSLSCDSACLNLVYLPATIHHSAYLSSPCRTNRFLSFKFDPNDCDSSR